MKPDLKTAAMRYANAVVQCVNAPSADVMAYAVMRDVALHDLIIAAGYACVFCDDGTCPYDDDDATNQLLTRPVVDTPGL